MNNIQDITFIYNTAVERDTAFKIWGTNGYVCIKAGPSPEGKCFATWHRKSIKELMNEVFS